MIPLRILRLDPCDRKLGSGLAYHSQIFIGDRVVGVIYSGVMQPGGHTYEINWGVGPHSFTCPSVERCVECLAALEPRIAKDLQLDLPPPVTGEEPRPCVPTATKEAPPMMPSKY